MARSPTSALAALGAVVALATMAGGCGHAAPGPALSLGRESALPPSHRSHIVEIVMENAEYGQVIGNRRAPYVNSLARRYGLLTHSYAITHPSLPNYLALTSGSTLRISSDCTGCSVAAPNLVDQLEAARISWRAYLEGLPQPCDQVASAGGYVKKHNPFAYYTDIAGSHARCARLAGFGRLAADLRAGTLPTFAWISPNLCDDGHDCGVGAGDRFLARTVPALLRELGPHGMLVLSWDEGVSNARCCGVAAGGHIATILAGPDVRAGSRAGNTIDHYGVLGSIEEALGLAPLAGAADPRSGRVWGVFARRARVR